MSVKTNFMGTEGLRAISSMTLFLATIVLAALVAAWGVQSVGMSVSKLADLSFVKANVKTGYVPTLKAVPREAFNVALAVPVVPSTPASTAIPEPTTAFTHSVSVESLRVRSGPNKSTPQLFALKGGTKVRTLKEERGWVMVDAGSGRVGWVYHKFLRPAADGGQLQAGL